MQITGNCINGPLTLGPVVRWLHITVAFFFNASMFTSWKFEGNIEINKAKRNNSHSKKTKDGIKQSTSTRSFTKGRNTTLWYLSFQAVEKNYRREDIFGFNIKFFKLKYKSKWDWQCGNFILNVQRLNNSARPDGECVSLVFFWPQRVNVTPLRKF